MSEKNYQGYDSSSQLQTSFLRGQIYNLLSNIHCSIVFYELITFTACLTVQGAIIIKINYILLQILLPPPFGWVGGMGVQSCYVE
jgi:hypothetical protein